MANVDYDYGEYSPYDFYTDEELDALINDYEAFRNLTGLDHNDILNLFKQALLTIKAPFTISIVVMYIPIFFIALIANFFVIYVLFRTKSVKNVTNYMLINLCVADVLIAVVCMPPILGFQIYTVWIYGAVMCKMISFLQGVCVPVSAYTLTAMAIDRYIAIKLPMQARRICTSGNAKRTIVLIWFMSILFWVPVLIHQRLVPMDEIVPSLKVCVERWDERVFYDVFLLLTVHVFPIILTFAAYIAIGRELWKEPNISDPSMSRRSDLRTGEASILAGRRRVAKNLLVLAVLFAICWLPHQVCLVYRDFSENDSGATLLTEIYLMCVWLAHAHSAINPTVYCIMNRNFRRWFHRTSCCGRAEANVENKGAGKWRRGGSKGAVSLTLSSCRYSTVITVGAMNDSTVQHPPTDIEHQL